MTQDDRHFETREHRHIVFLPGTVGFVVRVGLLTRLSLSCQRPWNDECTAIGSVSAWLQSTAPSHRDYRLMMA